MVTNANNRLVKQSCGTAALEAVLTLPIILCLMFFIIEILMMSDMQIALDSIVTEMTLDFMGAKKTDNFEAIIQKYAPKYMTKNKVSWYFSIYQDLNSMNNDNKIVSTASFEKKNGKDIIVSDSIHPERSFGPEKQDDLMKTLSQKPFVLTVVCDYNFASEFIGKCFFGFAGPGNAGDAPGQAPSEQGDASSSATGKGVSEKEGNEKFVIFSKCVGVCW